MKLWEKPFDCVLPILCHDIWERIKPLLEKPLGPAAPPRAGPFLSLRESSRNRVCGRDTSLAMRNAHGLAQKFAPIQLKSLK